MTENKQVIIPPGASRLPAPTQPARPSLPSLPTGNAVWGSERSRYDRNALTVAASANYMRARADQAAACIELIQKRDDLAMAIARLSSLGERCAHAYEIERLSHLNELHMLRLQHEHDEVEAKIRVAAVRLQLAQYEVQPEAPPVPTPPAAPAPQGLTPADVERAAQRLPEMNRETIETLCLMLSGLLAEKNK